MFRWCITLYSIVNIFLFLLCYNALSVLGLSSKFFVWENFQIAVLETPWEEISAKSPRVQRKPIVMHSTFPSTKMQENWRGVRQLTQSVKWLKYFPTSTVDIAGEQQSRNILRIAKVLEKSKLKTFHKDRISKKNAPTLTLAYTFLVVDKLISYQTSLTIGL